MTTSNYTSLAGVFSRYLCLSLGPLSVLLASPSFADAELVLDMSADVVLPAPGQPVEFVITVTNTGDAPAADVRVEDKLPPALTIPDGAAAYASTGTFDGATGTWTVGALEPATNASLALPVVVTDPAVPCIGNVARAFHAGSSATDDVMARQVLRASADAECVDMGVLAIIYLGTSIVAECDRRDTYHGHLLVTNHGPDTARGVVITIAQEDTGAPPVRIDDRDCVAQSAEHCVIDAVTAAETIAIDVTSDAFRNYSSFSNRVAAQVSSAAFDYAPDNDSVVETVWGQAFSSCDDVYDIDDIPVAGIPACFIATAAYGSGFDPHVATLRTFRDTQLAKWRWGRAFIRFYYRHSPPIAAFIADKPGLRRAVRVALTPLVYAIRYPLAALLFALLLRIGLPIGWRGLPQTA